MVIILFLKFLFNLNKKLIKKNKEEASEYDKNVHNNEPRIDIAKLEEILKLLSEKEMEIQKQLIQIHEKDEKISTLSYLLEQKDALVLEKDSRIKNHLLWIEQKDAIISDRDEQLKNLLIRIEHKDQLLVEKDAQVNSILTILKEKDELIKNKLLRIGSGSHIEDNSINKALIIEQKESHIKALEAQSAGLLQRIQEKEAFIIKLETQIKELNLSLNSESKQKNVVPQLEELLREREEQIRKLIIIIKQNEERIRSFEIEKRNNSYNSNNYNNTVSNAYDNSALLREKEQIISKYLSEIQNKDLALKTQEKEFGSIKSEFSSLKLKLRPLLDEFNRFILDYDSLILALNNSVFVSESLSSTIADIMRSFDFLNAQAQEFDFSSKEQIEMLKFQGSKLMAALNQKEIIKNAEQQLSAFKAKYEYIQTKRQNYSDFVASLTKLIGVDKAMTASVFIDIDDMKSYQTNCITNNNNNNQDVRILNSNISSGSNITSSNSNLSFNIKNSIIRPNKETKVVKKITSTENKVISYNEYMKLQDEKQSKQINFSKSICFTNNEFTRSQVVPFETESNTDNLTFNLKGKSVNTNTQNDSYNNRLLNVIKSGVTKSMIIHKSDLMDSDL